MGKGGAARVELGCHPPAFTNVWHVASTGIFMFVIEVIRKEMRGESEKGKNKRVSKSKVTPIEA